jgi:hypothetical protein
LKHVGVLIVGQGTARTAQTSPRNFIIMASTIFFADFCAAI